MGMCGGDHKHARRRAWVRGGARLPEVEDFEELAAEEVREKEAQPQLGAEHGERAPRDEEQGSRRGRDAGARLEKGSRRRLPCRASNSGHALRAQIPIFWTRRFIKISTGRCKGP